MPIALAASTALLLFLTGCGDADPSPDAAPPAADTDADDGEQDDDGELGDAREVLDERAVEGAGAQHLDFGETAQHGDVTVTVRSAEWADDEYQSDDSHWRDLILDVRFENRGNEDAEGPLITAHCRGQESFSNQHEGPIGVFDPLPAGTAADGEAVITVDLPCEDGWLAWSPEFDEESEWRWPMPAQD